VIHAFHWITTSFTKQFFLKTVSTPTKNLL